MSVSTTAITSPVIHSLLETDLYKFTMQQPMLHSMPTNQAQYRFVCRNTPDFPLAELAVELNAELDALCALRFTEDELGYLGGLRFLRSDYIEFLRLFQFHRRFIHVTTEGDTLHIVADGPQVHVMGFEIYVLAIVNELYYRRLAQLRSGVEPFLQEARTRLQGKIAQLRGIHVGGTKHPFEFFDFGVRRRFSGAWQTEMVKTLAREVPQFFKGTSNVLLAKECNLVPIGTMAHEYLQTFQATGVQLRGFQKAALETWVQEYRGDLGTALTDVVGMDAFLADFDLYFAKLFDGLRHDSGDPVEWGEKALAHYAKLKINANNKRLVFSDGLDIATAIRLHQHFADRVQTGFGIGTNLSNDTGLRPLNIVMKLVSCNGQPTAKMSDTPGKTLCEDATFLAYLRQIFNKPE
jgi:nicotinate phosphoribosyltransferase